MKARIGKVVVLLLIVLTLSISGCAYFAVRFAPEKVSETSHTALSQNAISTFWNNFHAGRYDQIPDTLKLLTAAYLENPRDPVVSLLLAHTHLWKLSERPRPDTDPTITGHLILAERYFTEAYRLNPKDHRILGWLGGVKLALGKIIHQDEKLTREGYFMLQDGISRFPEFNYFTAGFVMSTLPATHARHQEGLEYQWKNLDICVGEKIDRNYPDYRRFMALETTSGPRRVCWNSEIAPHNFEGFFLNMGDMLIKNGEAEKAKAIYSIARLSKEYASWKYRSLLEERIEEADERASLFREASPKRTPEMMFDSSYSCRACHEQ